MAAAIMPLAALLLGAAILLAGNGLQGILLPLRAALEGFANQTIGMIASAYSAGFVLGCLVVPHVIKRVGHIRSFAVLAALAASTVLVLVMLIQPTVWIVLRVVSGTCFAGLYMVIESWLNQQASNTNRGQVFSVYMVVNMGAVVAGQMLLPLGNPMRFELFLITAMAITLALIPVGLTRYPGPPPPQTVQLRLKRLYGISPVGMLGCFFVGLTNGAFGGLGAVYASDIGLSVAAIALFMSAAYLGGALAQMPLGRLSDRIDRRQVMILVCVVAAAAGLVLMVLGQIRAGGDWPLLGPWLDGLATPWIIVIVVLYGCCIYPLYGLCVAHANDFVAREEFVEASSGLLLTWAIGATIGPLVAAPLIDLIGPGGLFLYTALLHAAFVGIVAVRMRRRAARPPAERPDFVQAGTSRTSHAAVSLDPRAARAERPAPADPDEAFAK
jgi:MFS family permease